jgi:hypothetical protein
MIQKKNRKQLIMDNQQKFILPMELIWELIACIPGHHLIRLHKSCPTLSANLNFLIAKFSRLHVCEDRDGWKLKQLNEFTKNKNWILIKEIRERALSFIETTKRATNSYKLYEIWIKREHQALEQYLGSPLTPPPLNEKVQWFVGAYDNAEIFQNELLDGFIDEHLAGLHFNFYKNKSTNL